MATAVKPSKHDQQLRSLTDALRLCLTAVSRRSDELSDDAFTTAVDYLQEHVARVESDMGLNIIMLELKDGTAVDVEITGEEPL